MARKNPHAVALGRLGGSKGGKARAENLSPEELSEIGRKGGTAGGKARAEVLSPKQRSAIARKAAAARWKDKPKKEAAPGANKPAPAPAKKARKQ
ncbi:MAG: KGG domain-containing protein [Bryobacteraceae bacterium]